jgi:DNA-binding CsgD family transcriptional regulator
MADGAVRATDGVDARFDGSRADGLAALSPPTARVASLDASGLVTWTNAAWKRARDEAGRDGIDAAAVGTNYLAMCRRSNHPAAPLIAGGIEAVLRGEVEQFEVEYHADQSRDRRTQLVVAGAPQPPRSASVIQVDLGPQAMAQSVQRRRATNAASELTPREREVLAGMARGLDNQAIAVELGIGYTTVRAHTRSLMAKLDARSRLEAVVTALRRRIIDE